MTGKDLRYISASPDSYDEGVSRIFPFIGNHAPELTASIMKYSVRMSLVCNQMVEMGGDPLNVFRIVFSQRIENSEIEKIVKPPALEEIVGERIVALRIPRRDQVAHRIVLNVGRTQQHTRLPYCAGCRLDEMGGKHRPCLFQRNCQGEIRGTKSDPEHVIVRHSIAIWLHRIPAKIPVHPPVWTGTNALQ